MTSGRPPRIALVTSNGWGLGHLSRQIAVTLAIGEQGKVTMFSFSRGLPLTQQFGIRGEYCESYTSEWIPRDRWNVYVERRFGLFMDEVDPDVVLFDGVAPYVGILNALLHHPTVSAGWLRRGMWLRGRTDEQLAKSSAFDFVIEPGDLASEADTGPTAKLESIRVPPVSLLEVLPRLDRVEAARSLGIDPERPAVLLGLRSGQPGEAASAGSAALEQLARHPRWQVGVVNSPLAATGERGAGIPLDGVYPLVRYLDAFDAAISAAGYNSVHELIPAGIPTLLVPKSASRTDDQVARAEFLARKGMALVAGDKDPDRVRVQVDRLLGGDRQRLSETLRETPPSTGGAHAIAELLTGKPPRGNRPTGVEEWRQPGLKGIIKRTIGPSGVAIVRRVLGRVPEQPSRYPVTLDGVDVDGVARLTVTSSLSDLDDAPGPVEHMLPDASPGYARRRSELIEDFYEIVDSPGH